MSDTRTYRTRSQVPPSSVKLKEPQNKTLFEYPQDGSSTSGSITFTEHDLKRLKPPQFLNDTVISFFMQYHLDKHVPPETKERIHVFSSFFFSKLQSIRTRPSENYEESFRCVSRWLRGVEIFKKDFLVMPVCEKDHWVLVIVCYPGRFPSNNPNLVPNSELREPAVIVLNSWDGCVPGVKKSLNMFLRCQWLHEKGFPRKFNITPSNGMRLIFPLLPQQSNNYNCGVFTLNYFYCFMRNPRESYHRMYRKTDLTGWFEENQIEIFKERKRMVELIKSQMSLWKESPESHQDHDSECQEVHITSTSSHSNSSVDSNQENNKQSKKDIPVIEFN